MSLKDRLNDDSSESMQGALKTPTSPKAAYRGGRKKKDSDEKLQRLTTYVSEETLERIRQEYPSVSLSVAARIVIERAFKEPIAT